jgi:DNA-binding response OmpR family regulator/tetratricopeptide (TPR) repeat protein
MSSRILLAEDNEQLAGMLTTFLVGQGYSVARVATGSDAMSALAAGGVELLLLDLKLPGINGVEVLQRLRKSPQLATLPVIIITGVYRGEQYAAAARKLGVQYYLEKPFSREAFMTAVRSTLEGAARRLEPRRLRDLLLELFNNRKTGMLTLPEGLKISIMEGEPLSFLPGTRDDFAAFLQGRGKVTAEDLHQFIGSGKGRLTYTHAGLLPYDELVEESRLFLSRKLTELYDINPEAAFTEGKCTLDPPLVPISLPRLLYNAVATAGGHVDLPGFMTRYGAQFPSRTGLYYRQVNLVTMGRDEIAIMEKLGTGTSTDVIVAAAEHKGEAAAFLTFMLDFGMIAMHSTPVADELPDFPQKHLFNRPIEEEQQVEEKSIDFGDLVEEVSGSIELEVDTSVLDAPLSTSEIDFEQTVQRDFAALKDKNYYEIFGLTQGNFSFTVLKEAYFAKTRQYSPEKFMELSGANLNLAQDILSQYADAYNTLSSIVAKERYDEMLNANTIGLDGKQEGKLQASIQFQSGKVFLDMGEFDNAEKALQDAFTLEPQSAEHCAFLAWAIYRNPANRNSKNAQEKARTLLSKSLQIDRCPEAYTFRGWMLMDEGRDGLAEGEFQKALKLNPRDILARDGLKQINEKRENEKKGLFRRMFS